MATMKSSPVFVFSTNPSAPLVLAAHDSLLLGKRCKAEYEFAATRLYRRLFRRVLDSPDRRVRKIRDFALTGVSRNAADDNAQAYPSGNNANVIGNDRGE
jgi:hypothetical protein